MDVGCYCVNAMRSLVGEPERVYGRGLVSEGGVDLRFAALMSFQGNVVGQFDCAIMHVAPRHELEVAGEDGSLFLADPWFTRAPVIEHRHDGRVEAIHPGADDSYRLELENLSDAIRGQADPLLGREDAVGQARVIEALYASAEQDRPRRP